MVGSCRLPVEDGCCLPVEEGRRSCLPVEERAQRASRNRPETSRNRLDAARLPMAGRIQAKRKVDGTFARNRPL
jgi:hypothetical protein